MIFAVAVQFQSDGGLTAARAFTTLSIIELLTTPLGKVLQSLPSITASSACFGRIQEYLNSLDILDNRTSTGLAVAQHSLMLGEKRFETQVTESELHQDSYLDQVSPVVAFKDATLSYNTTSPSILDAITFEIQRASLTMIVGPVGSGKSTLLKAILGELRSQSGQVSVSAGSVSYCDQTPWIPNGIVRDTILGGLDMDQPWFDEVIKACALEKDIEALQGGLNTSVGSRGIALSEGQKQRVVGLASSKFHERHKLISLPGPLSSSIFSSITDGTRRHPPVAGFKNRGGRDSPTVFTIRTSQKAWNDHCNCHSLRYVVNPMLRMLILTI
jgi:ATP-binding cassette subfamily C (CFTR/MRP) protein 1